MTHVVTDAGPGDSVAVRGRSGNRPMAAATERGSVALEFVLLVPMILLLFGLVAGGARVWLARGAVVQAAASAARGASQARSSDEAREVGRALAQAQANTDGLRCERFEVSIDASVLGRAAGAAGSVSSRVECVVPLGDLLVPGWPGNVELAGRAEAVVDRYRGRR